MVIGPWNGRAVGFISGNEVGDFDQNIGLNELKLLGDFNGLNVCDSLGLEVGAFGNRLGCIEF